MRFGSCWLSAALAFSVPAAQAQDAALGGWKVIDQQNGYHVSLDTSVMHGGRASGHIVAVGTGATMAMFVSQAIRADEYRGKRVRFTAFLRARDARVSATMGGMLFMRAEGNGAVLIAYTTGSRPVGGNADWARRQIVLDIPPNALGMTFGFAMGGPGELWVDDATLEVVDSTVAVSRAPPARTPAIDRALARQQDKTYAGAPTKPQNLDFEQGK